MNWIGHSLKNFEQHVLLHKCGDPQHVFHECLKQWNISHQTRVQDPFKWSNDHPLLCVILLPPLQGFYAIVESLYPIWKHITIHSRTIIIIMRSSIFLCIFFFTLKLSYALHLVQKCMLLEICAGNDDSSQWSSFIRRP